MEKKRTKKEQWTKNAGLTLEDQLKGVENGGLENEGPNLAKKFGGNGPYFPPSDFSKFYAVYY